MYQDYLPILILLFFGVVMVALPLAIQSLISPKNKKGGEKLAAYECGEVPEGNAWVKFNIRFYIIALVFIVFDVEVVFMFPWAVVFNDMGFVAFIEMFIFIAILLVGFAYVWIKGDLDWVKMNLRYPSGRYKHLGDKGNE